MKKVIKNTFLFALLFSVCVNFCACSPVNAAVSTAAKILYSVAEIGENEAVESKYDYDCGLYYCYTQLDENDKQTYRTICDMLSYYKREFYVTGISSDDLVRIYHAVFYDHPELFWLTGGVSWTELYFSDIIAVYPEFWEYEKPIAECEAELETAIENLVVRANFYHSTFGKVLFVHDYLTGNVTYSDETYDLIMSDPETIANFEYSSAYGPLILKEAICGGYSTAFQILMQRLGIQCGIVTGDEHEWNFLKLDDEYYYMDVTWDCDESDNGEVYGKSYEFFCVTEDEILTSHSLDDDQYIPKCDGKKYDYCVANGYYLDYYDHDAVLDIIRKQVQAGNDCMYIKFGSSEETQKAVDGILKNGDIYSIDVLYYESLSYYRTMSDLCITVYKE